MLIYSLTLDFDLLDLVKLQKYLKSNNYLNDKIDSLTYTDNRNLDIILTNDLVETDITIINNLLSTYTNDYDKVYKHINLGFQKTELLSNEFSTVFIYNYEYDPNWKFVEILIKLNSITYTDTNSYTIRLVNIDKNQIIGNGMFNIKIGINEDKLPIYNNTLYKDNQIIEVQVKTETAISILCLTCVYEGI